MNKDLHLAHMRGFGRLFQSSALELKWKFNKKRAAGLGHQQLLIEEVMLTDNLMERNRANHI